MVTHDRLFKELLTTFFVEFLDLFFPDLLAYRETQSLTFLDKEVFTDVTQGEQFEADIIAKANVKNTKQQTTFLILLEMQSYNQPEFGKRLFRYFARFYEKYNQPVYPIVVFSYDTPYRPEPDTFTVTFPDLDVLTFRYRVVQLNRLDWRDFVNHPNPVASALMAKMRIAPGDRVRVKVECLRLLVGLGLDSARTQLISGFVDTYLRFSGLEEESFLAALGSVLGVEEEAMALEIVTSWMERGIEQGLAQGIEQGRSEGMVQLVISQLAARFGSLPETTETRIRGLSTAALGQLAVALLGFTSLADLDTWLNEEIMGRKEQAGS